MAEDNYGETGDEVLVVDREDEAADYPEPGRFAVVLLDDDFTPIDWVTDLLVRFFGKDLWDALDLTFEVHLEGSAVVALYTRDLAETKAAQVHELAQSAGHPLRARVQPDG